MLDKTTLRRSLIAARQTFSRSQREAWDASISDGVRAQLAARELNVLGIYWPIRGEPDLRPLYAELADSGLQLALPAVNRRDAPLAFFCWSPGDELSVDACGIVTPALRNATVIPDALIIPCVAFNAQRFRLGYGAGYYDRTLEQKPRPLTMGVAYASAYAAFDAAPHDVPMDVIVTERTGQT